MEILNYPLSEGFNNLYSEIQNCDFITPPFNSGIIGKDFFVERRGGLVNSTTLPTGVTKDAIVYRGATDKRIFYQDNTLVLDTGGLIENIGEITGLYPTQMPGEEFDFGVASVAGTATTLIDGTKSFTVNELAGKYILIYDGNAATQYQRVLSNTATVITVAGWTNSNIPNIGSGYRIYDQIVDTFIVSSITNNETSYYDGDKMVDIESATFDSNNNLNYYSELYKSRRWFTDNKKRLYYTFQGQYGAPEGLLEVSNGNIQQIIRWGSYLLILTDENIQVVRELNISGSIVFTIEDLVDERSYGENAAFIYNSGLFFISGDKRLYSLSISISNNFLTGNIEEQGLQLRNYFDSVDSFDIYTISNKDGFIIGLSEVDNTLEIKFNGTFLGYHTNTFNTKIYKRVELLGQEYLLNGTGIGTLQKNSNDLGSNFEQKVSLFFGGLTGVSGALSVGGVHIDRMKKVRMIKFALGNDLASYAASLRVEANMSVIRNTKLIDLDKGEYAKKLESISSEYGDMEYGTQQYGGGNNLKDTLADEGILATSFNDTAYLMKYTITNNTENNGFIFGGMSIFFSVENPLTHNFNMNI